MSYILLLDLAQSVLTFFLCIKKYKYTSTKVMTPDMRLFVVIT